MADAGDEERLLHSVALQNAHSILLARQRAEQELIRITDALELKTRELAKALQLTQRSLEERDRARADAEEARIAAQAANEAKSGFLNMISHELRTPLGAIGGYADLIDAEIRGPLNEGQREFISRIRHNQKHLLGLVNQLLDIAKIEAGRVDLTLSPMAVQAVIDSVRLMIEPQALSRKLRLEIESPDPTLVLFADRERVEQIVLNLLSNAVKFTADGGTITVKTNAEPDHVNISVEDTGVGIEPDKLEAVFEPFVQAPSSLTDRPRGTGLGLAISRQLARAMGGDLSVESVLRQGSTFTLSLPRSEAKSV